MADKHEIRIDVDWTDAKRSTKEYVDFVERETKKLRVTGPLVTPSGRGGLEGARTEFLRLQSQIEADIARDASDRRKKITSNPRSGETASEFSRRNRQLRMLPTETLEKGPSNAIRDVLLAEAPDLRRQAKGLVKSMEAQRAEVIRHTTEQAAANATEKRRNEQTEAAKKRNQQAIDEDTAEQKRQTARRRKGATKDANTKPKVTDPAVSDNELKRQQKVRDRAVAAAAARATRRGQYFGTTIPRKPIDFDTSPNIGGRLSTQGTVNRYVGRSTSPFTEGVLAPELAAGRAKAAGARAVAGKAAATAYGKQIAQVKRTVKAEVAEQDKFAKEQTRIRAQGGKDASAALKAGIKRTQAVVKADAAEQERLYKAAAKEAQNAFKAGVKRTQAAVKADEVEQARRNKLTYDPNEDARLNGTAAYQLRQHRGLQKTKNAFATRQIQLPTAAGGAGGGGPIYGPPAPPALPPLPGRGGSAQQQLQLEATEAARARLEALRESVLYEKAIAKEANKQAKTKSKLTALERSREALEERILARLRLDDTDATGNRGHARGLDAVRKSQEGLAERRVVDANLPEIASNNALSKRSKDQQAAAEARILRGLKSRADLEGEATDAVAIEKQRLEKRLRVATVSLGEDQKQLVIEKEITGLKRQVATAESRLATAAQQAKPQPTGTRFQHSYAKLHPGLDVDRAPTAGQFIKSRTLQSAGFAVGGGLLYGGLSAAKETVREAEELERIFNQIQSQFKSLGQIDVFPAFRDEILSIARDTGAAGDEVASVGFQFQGAFGGNTARAMAETRSAFEAVKVTGLEITEVIDAFTALTENFEAAGVSIDDVTSKALGLQERFGVLAKETIAFASDLAPVAAGIGLTVEELESLGAVAQKYSGRSGTSLSEAYGRILPAIGDNSVGIVQTLRNSAASDAVPEIQQAFRAGQTGDAFKILIANYDKLTDSQQKYLVGLLGGRREAAALIPVFENSAELLRELNNEFADAGRLNQYYSKLQDTLAQKTDRFGESLKQLGIRLFNAGIKDTLAGLADFGIEAAESINLLIDSLGELLNKLDLVSDPLSKLLTLDGRVAGADPIQALGTGLALYAGVRGAQGLFGRNKTAATTAASPAGAIAGNTLPLAATAAGPPGFTERYRAGRDAAKAANAARAVPGAPGLNYGKQSGIQAGKNAAKGFGAGLKSGFSGVNFGLLGATIGLSIFEQITSNIAASGSRSTAKYAGTDGILDENEANQQLIAELGEDKDLEFIKGKIAEASAKEGAKISDVFKELNEIAFEDLSLAQQAIVREAEKNHLGTNQLGLVNAEKLSGDYGQNVAAVNNAYQIMLDEATNGLDELLQNDIVIDDITTQRTGIEKGNSGWDKARKETVDNLSEMKAGIADNTLTTADLRHVFETVLGVEVPQALKDLDVQAARIADFGSIEGALIVDTAASLQRNFEAGVIGIGQYRDDLETAIDDMINNGFAGQLATEKQKSELAGAKANLLNSGSQRAVGKADFAIKEYELSNGAGAGLDQFKASTYTALLESGELNPEDQDRISNEVVEALKAVVEARAAAAGSAEESARILAAGMALPEVVQVNKLEAYLFDIDENFNNYAADVTANVIATVRGFTNRVALLSVRFGESVRDATIRAMKEERARINAEFAMGGGFLSGPGTSITPELDADIARLEGEGFTGPDGNFEVNPPNSSGRVVGDNPADKAKKNANDAMNLELALLEVEAARAGDDAVAVAAIAIRKAKVAQRYADGKAEAAQALAQLIAAERQYTMAVQDGVEAQRDLDLARANDDSVAAARAGLANAQDAVKLAQGAAAKAAAMAAEIRAQRTLATATFDLMVAQRDMVIALAEQAGDSVAVAKEQLRISREKLGNSALGLDDTAKAQLRADIVRQETQVRDAILSEERATIDYQLAIGDISQGQAISALQGLLAIPNLAEEQIREINLAIKNMRDQLGQDYQFNLPSSLALPTVYEVRRLGQSESAGSGYNDNRQIVVNVTAQTNADPNQIAAAVSEAVGDPTRSGTLAKRY